MKAKSSKSGKVRTRLLLSAALALGGIVFALDRIATAQTSELASLPQAAGEPSAFASRGMDAIVSLDFRSTEVTDALKYLATKGELNLAISKDVTGRVNLFLTDVTIRDVFDLILRGNELAYDMKGGIYNVMTEDEYRKFCGEKFSDLREVRTFRLQYAIPQQAFNLLDTLKSEIGRLLVDEDSGTVLVMDTPTKLQEMTEALATLEQSATIRVFDLQYAKAVDVEAQLKDQIEINKLGYVKADEPTNQLIVKTLPERMREVERLIGSLDRKTRQVLIDAKIVKVTLTNVLDTGLDWKQIFTNLDFHGIDTVGDFRVATTGTAPSEVPALTRFELDQRLEGALGQEFRLGDLLFGTIARDGYELFRYIETLGETKIISSPRLLVTEGQEARIHAGTREAYVTTTTTTGQTTTTTAEEIEFIDVGIQLVVTPTINRDGYVSMKIKPEISSVVRTLTTPTNNQIPIVDTSTAETNVLVKDGTTVVIGGLRKKTKKVENDQVPILGRIPLLGELFRQRDKDDELSDLIVFITPHIVEGDELITGDEEKFGRSVKAYREYEPLLSD